MIFMEHHGVVDAHATTQGSGGYTKRRNLEETKSIRWYWDGTAKTKGQRLWSEDLCNRNREDSVLHCAILRYHWTNPQRFRQISMVVTRERNVLCACVVKKGVWAVNMSNER